MKADVKILSRRIFDDNDIDSTLADYIDLIDSAGRLIITKKKVSSMKI